MASLIDCHCMATTAASLRDRLTACGFQETHAHRGAGNPWPRVQGASTREAIDGVDYLWLRTPAYRGNGAGRLTTGATAIVIGALALLIPIPMAASHTWDGINYADAFHAAMIVISGILIVTGIAALAAPGVRPRAEPSAIPAAV